MKGELWPGWERRWDFRVEGEVWLSFSVMLRRGQIGFSLGMFERLNIFAFMSWFRFGWMIISFEQRFLWIKNYVNCLRIVFSISLS